MYAGLEQDMGSFSALLFVFASDANVHNVIVTSPYLYIHRKEMCVLC